MVVKEKGSQDGKEPDQGSAPTPDGGDTISRRTVRLAWSIFIGMLASLALQVWTVAFIGWQGSDALYVRSVYAPVGFVTLAVTEGLIVSAQVAAGVMARNGGRDRALQAVPTFLYAGAGLLALTAVTFLVVPGPLTGLLGVPAEHRTTVVAFIVLTSVSSAFGLVPTLAGAALRGVGQAGVSSALGVAFALLSALAMVGLDMITDLGVYIVPIAGFGATLIVGAVTAVLLPRYGLTVPSWKATRDAVGWLTGVALPVAGTFLLLSTVSLGYLRVLRGAEEFEITGFSLGQMIQTFTMVAALAIGSGAAIAVTTREGEDRAALAQEGMRALLRVVFPVYALIAAVTFFLRGPVTDLFTDDEAVAAVARDFQAWVGPTLLLFGATLALITYLEQVGHARAAFLLNLSYFAILLSVAFLLPEPVSGHDLSVLLAVGNVVGFGTLMVSTWLLVRRPVNSG
ncbi:MATE family efflux transporter [Streptomyces sp. NPDC085479]|uniref:MATE family efflux transporter n=1 Tax=Streptomyces sp. NPDC085479 TaxID=3365726 RepID=UPI0037D1811F